MSLIFDKTLNYNICGYGKPLLFIHGFPLSHKIWDHQIKFFSDHNFKTITLDLPGFGDSKLDSEIISLDFYSERIKKLLDFLKIDQFILAGMSMGGYISLNFFDKFPEKVEKLILIATKSGDDDTIGKNRRTELIELCKKEGTKPIIDIFIKILWDEQTFISDIKMIKTIELEMLKASKEGIISGLTAMREREDFSKKLNKIQIPTLILHSTRDKAIPFINAEIMNKGSKNSKLVTYEIGGHMINMEIPELVNKDILNFLEKNT